MASESLNKEIAETSRKGFESFVKLSAILSLFVVVVLLLMAAFLL
jgi:hypothetical protein